MTYRERELLREEIMQRIFKDNNALEDMVRDKWQSRDYLPSNKEVRDVCNRMTDTVKEACKKAITDSESYKAFIKECDEIKERFWKLDAKRSIDSCCGVYQVGYYLYDEAFEKVSKALDFYVPEENGYEDL